MKRIVILLVAFILVACASTGVLPKGNETYTIEKKISKVFSGSPDDVRFEVYQEAASFCSTERKGVDTIKLEITPDSGFFKTGKVFLEFRCK
jgi:hypothetical protein